MWSMSVERDRKSTRLNSSHRCISYAVFCLKKKEQERCFKPLEASEGATDDAFLGHSLHASRACNRRQPETNKPPSYSFLRLCFFFLNNRPPTGSTPFPPPAAFS